MTAFPPVPELTVIVPLPLVGDEDTGYVALSAAPETGPLGAPLSSCPAMLPVGLAPSAGNRPGQPALAEDSAVFAEPPYVPLMGPCVNHRPTRGPPTRNT